MGEAEFDRLLDVVRAAVAPPCEDALMAGLAQITLLRSPPHHLPRAANDNGLTWPLIPFPDGWYAAC